MSTSKHFRYSVNTSGCDKNWDFAVLSAQFKDQNGTLETVKDDVKAGHAICAGLLNGKWRKKANFAGSYWILSEIDNSTIWKDENDNPLDENGIPVSLLIDGKRRPVDINGSPIEKADRQAKKILAVNFRLIFMPSLGQETKSVASDD